MIQFRCPLKRLSDRIEPAYVVMKTFVRGKNPICVESDCAEGNQHVVIEDEPYMLSSDGFLMPSKKGQRPPDFTYFNVPKK